MEHRFKVKVWKDRLAATYPPKWSWEVVEVAGKVVGCGTTASAQASRETANRVVETRLAALRARDAAHQQMLQERDWAHRVYRTG